MRSSCCLCVCVSVYLLIFVRQRLCKHVPLATSTRTTIEECRCVVSYVVRAVSGTQYVIKGN
jgi:hypothetical protein